MDDKNQNSEFSYVYDPKEECEQNKNKFYKYGKIFFLFGTIACIILSIFFILTIGTIIYDTYIYY